MTDAIRTGAPHATPLSARFAQRALGRAPVPGAVMDRAQLLMADFIACSLRGSAQPSSRAAAAALEALYPRARDAHGHLQGPPDAESLAFMGGLSGHSIELDDTHEAGSLHAGTVIWPTVLTLAGLGAQSCDATLRAAVAGYDAICTLGVLAGGKAQYEHGFHPTGVCGAIGAAVAAGVMLGLSEPELVSAIGIAASLAGGTLAFLDDGGWTKPMHAGAAAAHGIRAAYMARAGFLGPAHSLDGRFGVPWAFAGVSADAPQFQAPLPAVGTGVSETSVKLYPCCRYIHGTLDLLLALRAEQAFEPGEVERIECGVLSAGFALVAAPPAEKVAVRGEVDAQFSLPYAAALALTRGEATLEGFARAAELAPTLRPLMERVECVRSPALDRGFPALWGAAVRVELAGGRTIERATPHSRGSPSAPVGWDELEAKIAGLVGAPRARDLVRESRRFAGSDAARERVPVHLARQAATHEAR